MRASRMGGREGLVRGSGGEVMRRVDRVRRAVESRVEVRVGQTVESVLDLIADNSVYVCMYVCV